MYTLNFFLQRILFFVCLLVYQQVCFAQPCTLSSITPGLNYNTSNTLCEGSDIDFTIIVPNLPSGCIVDEYRLNTPSGSVFPLSPSYTVLGAMSGDYDATFTIVDDGSLTCPCVGNVAVPTSNVIRVDPIPSAPTVNGAGTACIGEQVFLGVQTGNPPNTNYQFYWYGSATGVPFSPSGPVLYQGQNYTTPPISSATNYYVTVKSGACESAATQHAIVPVTVSPPILLNSNPTTVCSGNSVQLGINSAVLDSNEVAYWYSDANATNLLHIGNIFTSPILTSATTYYVRIVNHLHQCESTLLATNTINIQTIPSPNVPTIVNNCQGEQAILTGMAGQVNGFLEWYDDLGGQPNHLLHLGNSFTTDSLVSSRTYYVREVLPNGCVSNPVPIVLVPNALPIEPIITSNAPLCTGDDLTIGIGNITGGVSYEWFGPNYNTIVQQDTIYNVNAVQHQGNYRLVVRDNNTGCKNSDTLAVLVYNQPQTPTISGNNRICTGDSIQLTATAINNATYVWSYPNATGTLTTGNILEVPLSITNQGVFTVSASVNGCVSAVGSQVVEVLLPPVVTGSSNTPICKGEVLELNSTSIAGAHYYWSDANGYSSTHQINQLQALDAGQHNYYLQVEKEGCTTLDTVTVTINSLPSIGQFSISNPYTICEEDNLSLAVNIPPTLSGNWNGPNGLTTLGTDTIINASISSIHTGIYHFHVIENITGCTNDTMINIIVNPKPESPVLENSGIVCEGEALQIWVQGANNQVDYQWTNSQGQILNLSDTTITSVSVLDAGQYTAIASENGCSSFPSMMLVEVNSNPVLQVSSDTIVEEGEKFLLYASGANTYFWEANSSVINFINPYAALTEIAPIDLQGQGNNSPYSISVTGTTTEGCSTTEFINLNVSTRQGVVVYNTFTPNRDGKNETFSIDFISNLEAEGYEVTIYDKSGVIVWSTDNYPMNEWDGTYQGSTQQAPSGAYYYAIVSKENSFKQRGGIMLLRSKT